MRTEVEGEDAPQPGDRNNEASFTQNAQNTPSETPGLSDIKQKPEAIPGDNTEELANAIPNDGGEHPDKWIKGIPLFMVTSGITLVIFLMLLDMSILSTVCHPAWKVWKVSLI